MRTYTKWLIYALAGRSRLNVCFWPIADVQKSVPDPDFKDF
jgi:hypothetical protein